MPCSAKAKRWPWILLAIATPLACFVGWIEYEKSIVVARKLFVARLLNAGDGDVGSAAKAPAMPLAIAYLGGEQIGRIKIADDRPDLADEARRLFSEARVDYDRDPEYRSIKRKWAAEKAAKQSD